MSYDPKCYRLACDFLVDHPGMSIKEADELAEVIQDAIEDYISMEDFLNQPPRTKET